MVRREPGERHVAEIREAAKSHAIDHYLSALLAPGDVRDDLLVLAAWWGETGRISQEVRDGTLGEIRLQWWRDVLPPGAGQSGHPTADALGEVVTRRGLDHGLLEGILDARSFELHMLPFADEAAFSAYLARSDGALAQLKAQVLGGAPQAPLVALSLAGQSYGRARVARDLARWTAMGRLPLWPHATGAEDGGSVVYDSAASAAGARYAINVLAAEARATRRQLLAETTADRGRLIDAILPVALVEPYFSALEAEDFDPLANQRDISPLSRVARLAWARYRGRV